MAENLSNFYNTTMNDSGGISNSDTSVVVTSASGAPAANFRMVIQDSATDITNRELVLVTNVAGTTFTITRGVEGTSAVTHADGSYMAHVLTASGLDTYIPENVIQTHGTLVQHKASAFGTTSPTTIVLDSAPVNGNLLYLFTGCSANVTVTPTQTNVSWSSIYSGANTAKLQLWKGVVSASASATITLTRASGSAFYGGWASEWSGLTGTLTDSPSNGSTSQMACTPVVDVSADHILLCAAVSTAGTGTWSSPNFKIGAASNFIWFGYRLGNFANNPIGAIIHTAGSVTWTGVIAAIT